MIIRPDHPDELIRFLSAKPLILYGMGDTGKRIAEWCSEHRISYLISDQSTDKLSRYDPAKVVPLQRILRECPTANIAISSIAYVNEITEDLLRLGIAKERILPPFIFMPSQITIQDLEVNGLVDWERMRQRCKMISTWGWIPDDIQTVVDYSAGEGFPIKKYLPENAVYYPIDYVDRGGHTMVCDFAQKEYPDIYAGLSVCFAMVMYTGAPYELIDNICKHTQKLSLFTAITLEGFPDIRLRRYSGMVSDLTKQEIVDRFAFNRFHLRGEQYHSAGNSTMTFFLFERAGESKCS